MKQFYVGVKGVINDPERGILLVHKADSRHSVWELPGGRMNDNESFEDTLLRELREEIPNIGSIAIGEMLGASKADIDFPDQPGLILLYFSVQAHLPDPITLSDEHDEYMFYQKGSDIPEPISPDIKNILIQI